jgi:hypothetical protein
MAKEFPYRSPLALSCFAPQEGIEAVNLAWKNLETAKPSARFYCGLQTS